MSGLTVQDWSDLCSILTHVDAAIIASERRGGSWGQTSPQMQRALKIARDRHAEAVKTRAAPDTTEREAK
jgi:hypothetical protein